jgi:hypothetical protein
MNSASEAEIRRAKAITIFVYIEARAQVLTRHIFSHWSLFFRGEKKRLCCLVSRWVQNCVPGNYETVGIVTALSNGCFVTITEA